MSREIKFRAWHKESGSFYHDGWSLSMDGQCWYDDNDHEHDVNERFVIMQYTGLKDKNGKEIFEGDIIKKIEGNQEYKGEVVFGKRTLGFGVHVNYQHHRYTNSEGKEIKLYRDKFYRLNGNDEIIGNIYEHTHLLQKSAV